MTGLPANRIATRPGALLLEQIRETGPGVRRVARDVDLPATRLHEIVHERRGVSDGTAIAPGTCFGQSPEFRINARMAHELSKELAGNGEKTRARVRRRAEDRTAA